MSIHIYTICLIGSPKWARLVCALEMWKWLLEEYRCPWKLYAASFYLKSVYFLKFISFTHVFVPVHFSNSLLMLFVWMETKGCKKVKTSNCELRLRLALVLPTMAAQVSALIFFQSIYWKQQIFSSDLWALFQWADIHLSFWCCVFQQVGFKSLQWRKLSSPEEQ